MCQTQARRFHCVRCQKVVVICSSCDRGNTHCSQECSKASRQSKQREPVRVIRHDRLVGVMVSAEDYETMRAYYADCLLKTMVETALAAEKAGPTPEKRKQLLADGRPD